MGTLADLSDQVADNVEFPKRRSNVGEASTTLTIRLLKSAKEIRGIVRSEYFVPAMMREALGQLQLLSDAIKVSSLI